VEAKPDIRQLSIKELISFFEKLGEKKFRAKQVYEWLWVKSATEFDAMTNLSLPLRVTLKENFTIPKLQVDVEQHSTDGTVKLGFKLHDDHLVEGVLIPVAEDKRMTACISSQVGCSLSCKFCATGFLKRERNLVAHEIYDQVVAINKIALEKFNLPLTNIVFMGMGEPLLNYKNVLAGIDRITNPNGLGMSPKRITISTAGIAKMIKKLVDDDVKVNLALSLHAANDTKRDQIMPINEQNNLAALTEALNYFTNNNRNKITYEYILLRNFNDSEEDALELVEFCKKVPAMINIIEYNKVEGTEFEKAGKKKLNNFINILVGKQLKVTVRKSRGEDIDAACGQLANK